MWSQRHHAHSAKSQYQNSRLTAPNVWTAFHSASPLESTSWQKNSPIAPNATSPPISSTWRKYWRAKSWRRPVQCAQPKSQLMTSSLSERQGWQCSKMCRNRKQSSKLRLLTMIDKMNYININAHYQSLPLSPRSYPGSQCIHHPLKAWESGLLIWGRWNLLFW